MADPTRNYLEILGLTREASSEDLKKAFKNLAFQYHPDRNPHNARAEEKFKEVLEAYSFLTGNMEAFQALKAPPRSGTAPADQVQDIYEILFDIELAPAPTRGKPLRTDLVLRAEEAFRGGEMELKLERWDWCLQCNGTGAEKGAKKFTCTYCFGEGEVDSLAEPEGRRECPKCNGRGFLSSKPCLKCRARGVRPNKCRLLLNVPPRISPGSVLILEGEGNEFQAGERGALEIHIILKEDPRFSFDGQDIICETTVGLGDAALGGEVVVPTLEGPRPVTIPAGTQSGRVLRLKGMGLGGDQFIRIWVKTPTVTTEKERRVLHGFKTPPPGRLNGLWGRLKKWIW